MATNTIEVGVRPHDVFEVLADGWRYSAWVVGTSHMAAVQREWPAAGSTLHHVTGAWPLVLRERTVVEAVETDRRLVLTAYGKYLGAARISIELDAVGKGCRITMDETPVAGLGGLLAGPVLDVVLRWRNRESLRRLAALAERRTEPA